MQELMAYILDLIAVNNCAKATGRFQTYQKQHTIYSPKQEIYVSKKKMEHRVIKLITTK